MPSWKFRIDLADLWREVEQDEGWKQDEQKVAAFARQVAERIKASLAYRVGPLRDWLGEIVEQFEDCSTIEDFNLILDDLYDLGDAERIWIATVL